MSTPSNILNLNNKLYSYSPINKTIKWLLAFYMILFINAFSKISAVCLGLDEPISGVVRDICRGTLYLQMDALNKLKGVNISG